MKEGNRKIRMEKRKEKMMGISIEGKKEGIKETKKNGRKRKEGTKERKKEGRIQISVEE